MVKTLNTSSNALLIRSYKDKRKRLCRREIVYTTNKSKFPVLTQNEAEQYLKKGRVKNGF